MTLIDTILLLIVVVGAVIGFRKGLIGQLATIVAFALGVAACVLLGDTATQALLALNPKAAEWPMSGVTVHAVAVAVLFLLVALTVRVAAFFVKRLVKAVHFGPLDKAGGAALCIFKWVFGLSIALNLWLAVSPHSEVFSTRHALDNKPFEATLNLMPRILGSDALPGDSLQLSPAEKQNEEL